MKEFKTSDAVNRVQEFVDRLARKAWGPFYRDEDGYPKNTLANQNYFDYNGNQVHQLYDVLEKSSSSFRGTLMRNANILPNQEQPQKAPSGFDIAAKGSGWTNFEYEKIIDIVKSNAVNSVADAMVKTTAYLQTIAGSIGHGNKRYLFRGQSNIEHELKPRLGRIISQKIDNGELDTPTDHLKVTDIELEAIKEFQKLWPTINKEALDEFNVGKYTNDDAGWWVLMQHYADGVSNGTRMLDVTSSLLFALLFACVKWDTGLIDDTTDGIVYFFVEGQNCAVNDYSTSKIPTAENFFTVQNDISYMIFNPPHNERSKAQGGGFIWWPKFWKPLNHSLPYLRIPKENKLQIAKELLAFGVGPKEAVRGKKGMDNESALRSII